MKKLMYFMLLAILTIAACYWQDIDFEGIIWSPIQTDCSSDECHLWAPGKAFSSPVLGTIMERRIGETPNWVNVDTFFLDSLLVDPYLMLAGILNVPDSLVCSLTTYQNGVLSIPTGKIFFDSAYTTASHVIRVDTLNHPYFQLGFSQACN